MPYPAGTRKTPRILARNAGEVTYKGTPCRVCGSPLKYVVQGSCVMCHRRLSAIRNRKLHGKGPDPLHLDPVAFRKDREAKDRRKLRQKLKELASASA